MTSETEFNISVQNGVKYYDSFDYGLIRRYPDPTTQEDYFNATTETWEPMHLNWRVDYIHDATPIRTYAELQQEIRRYSRH